MKRLPAIDGLRAVAVLAVVAYHAGLPVPAGYVGVDIFFVISGYVITRMLSSGRIDLLDFYKRRARRILPALIVVIAVTLLFAQLGAPELQVATTNAAFAALAMSANIYFHATTGNYFDIAADQLPLIHLWSLGVEEQFYLLWPLLLMLRKRWLILALAVASLALAQYWIGHEGATTAFYQMPARFWELALGGLVAMAPASRLGGVATVAGVVAIALGIGVESAYFPGLGAAMPVAGTALVLHAIHSGSRIVPLEWAPVRYVGLVSYSFYLWHWPLLALNRGISLDPIAWWEPAALCGLAFVLAALSYHFIETPFRRGTFRLRAIGAGVVVVAVLAGCANYAAKQEAIDLDARGATYEVFQGCFVDQLDPATLPDPAKCGDGDVVLWGDSHAFMWLPVAERFGDVYTATRSGCPPSLGDKGEPLCREFAKAALERAKQARVVVLAAHWPAGNNADHFGDVLDALADVPRVIVMGPLPEMPYQPRACLARERPEACRMERADFDAMARPLSDSLRNAIRQHPNAEFIDPSSFFCEPDVCPLLKDGMPLFRDRDHISVAASRAFAETIRNPGTPLTAE